VFQIKIRAVVSLDKLEEAIKRLQSEQRLAANYRELQRENSQLRSQLKELRKESQGVRMLLIEPAPKSQNRQRASELVQSAITAQNLSQKIDLATQAVIADDQFIDGYIVRGQTYLRIASLAFSRKPRPDELANYLERARADFDRALALDPSNTWALLGRGDTLTWYKKAEEAAKDYERILEIDPLFDLARQRLITLYTTLARKQAMAKHWRGALATLDRLLGTQLSDSWLAYQKEAYLLRSEIYAKLKQPQRAIEDLSVVVWADPTDKEAFLRRAKLYQELMLGRLAKDDFERACALGSTVACERLP
jgi:tetratricopeptide (TPR) repeat protein